MTEEKKSFFSFWNEHFRNGALWGAAAMAVVLLIGGSFWPGWQLDSTAKEARAAAKVEALAAFAPPFCQERFTAKASEAEKKKLAEASDWQRDGMMVKMDWFPKTGISDADLAIGEKCAALIAPQLEKFKAE